MFGLSSPHDAGCECERCHARRQELIQIVAPSEWMKRYRQRMIDVAHISENMANLACAAVDFEDISEGYEDDPEGAADEEMSYWTD